MYSTQLTYTFIMMNFNICRTCNAVYGYKNSLFENIKTYIST